MQFSEPTTALLSNVEQLARTLAHKNELGILIELAHQHNTMQALDDLSFFAKFSHKTFGIMQRIGKDGEGYDKLAKEFGESVEKSKQLINELLSTAPNDVKEKFSTTFLSMSPSSFQNLISLFRDLSWYKNFLIDSRKA